MCGYFMLRVQFSFTLVQEVTAQIFFQVFRIAQVVKVEFDIGPCFAVAALVCSLFIVSLEVSRPSHRHQVWTCFLSSTSCDGFGTRFWSDVQWGTAHEQFRFVSFEWGNDWNGTLFPAPKSGIGYKFAGLVFVLQISKNKSILSQIRRISKYWVKGYMKYTVSYPLLWMMDSLLTLWHTLQSWLGKQMTYFQKYDLDTGTEFLYCKHVKIG